MSSKSRRLRVKRDRVRVGRAAHTYLGLLRVCLVHVDRDDRLVADHATHGGGIVWSEKARCQAPSLLWNGERKNPASVQKKPTL